MPKKIFTFIKDRFRACIKKPVFLSALALVLVLIICIVGLYAGDDKTGSELEYGDTSKGIGERINPYLIETVDDFLELLKNSADGNDFENMYFLQTADLNFSDVADFEPIPQFDGIYNGGGHKIIGISFEADGDGEYAAIFAEMNGTVMNLGVEDCRFSAPLAAGIAAYSDSSDAGIYNCYSNVQVSGHYTGGISAVFSGKIIACHSSVTAEIIELNASVLPSDGTAIIPDGAYSGDICGASFGSVIDCISEASATGFGAYTYTEVNCTSEKLTDGRLSSLHNDFLQNVKEYVSPNEMQYALLFEESGTEADPYLINGTADFCRMRDLVNAGISFDAHHFRQTADLDFSETDNFVPIGYNGTDSYFWGHYNGDGHTLSNLKIIFPDSDVALFVHLAGSIMNLGIESGTVQGGCIGSFTNVNGADDTFIANCYSKAELIASGRAGGIADRMFGANIINCCFAGTIEAGGEAAGISTYQSTGRVINCRSVGYEPLGNETSIECNYGTCSAETAAQAFSDVSKSIYDSAAWISEQSTVFYKMSENGFTEKYPMKLALLWREALALTVIFAVLFAVMLIYKKYTKPRENAFVSLKDDVSARMLHPNGTRGQKMKTAFYLTLVFCAAMFFVGVLCGDKQILNAFVYSYGEDVFMDFFNPMHTMLTRNVEQAGYFSVVGETYPPLAQGILWFFGQFLPTETALSPALSVRSTAYGAILLFSIFAVVAFILYALYLKTERGETGRGKYFIPFLFCLCPPLVVMVERGNVIFAAFIFSALFVSGYRSENPIIRNLSYACLGFAAAIKIYPAVLGLLVLREKNAKHTLQCLSWGIGFMIIPFAFCGGMTSLSLYLRNIGVSFQNHSVGHDKWALNYGNIMYLFTKNNIDTANSISQLTIYPFMALLLSAGLICRKHWKVMLSAVLILLLYPGFSLYYMGIFMLFPLLAFFAEKEHGRIDWLYLILLAFPLLPLQFLCGIYGVDRNTVPVICSIDLILLALLFIADTAVSIPKRLKSKRKAR